MPLLWRLYRAAHGTGLDGSGGMFAEGRWHSRGDLVVYFGGSAAITVLERLAHTDPDLLPDDLELGVFELPDQVARAALDEFGGLPAGWQRDEPATRQIGARWREQGTSCVLAVPSAILPEEFNFVFNPKHSDAQRLRLVRKRPFEFDTRLIA